MPTVPRTALLLNKSINLSGIILNFARVDPGRNVLITSEVFEVKRPDNNTCFMYFFRTPSPNPSNPVGRLYPKKLRLYPFKELRTEISKYSCHLDRFVR